MRGIWNLKEEEKKDIKNIIIAVIEYLINHKDTDSLILSCIDISPSQILDILKELGYKVYENNFKGNLKGDSWWRLYKENDEHFLLLFYCGYTFNMGLALEEKEENE